MNIPDGTVMHAGFPNAAEDSSGFTLSIDKLIINHPTSTYLWSIGDAVDDLGWLKGDIAVVDRSLTPKPRQLVVVVLQDDFYVRRYVTTKGGHRLERPNGEAETVEEAIIWGVITYVIQKASNR